ncbi:hypothetical protein CAPTEDRAFT_183880 [Capitella teleta]|uniref:FHF complex subunit HOOK-interacting protein C-terminal domain-containing protein n=1 Tax=Capitella teleta TaxID=283909 RepID=R7TAZ2_CAPTE|nr:hypothetical protein CAPTEDRAFT_183880 [Capitella teleta]|eukprot:ELT88159.1 hypothetical protein CAPTEDRAFT_183880 [Capitella teleta]
MSLFKRFTNKQSSANVPSTNGHSDTDPSSRPVPPSPLVRPRSNTDPDTCLEVYKSHWMRALCIINGQNSPARNSSAARQQAEELEAVMRYVDQMNILLIEEDSLEGGQGPILEYLLTEDILNSLVAWGLSLPPTSPDAPQRIKLYLLKIYELLISQSRQSMMLHKPVIRPLFNLVSTCSEDNKTKLNVAIETRLILILHQLCVCVTQNKQILELLFNATADHGSSGFLMFSLLIPYTHREGAIGQQARDALLLIMSLSYSHDDIGVYIAEQSHFCPVLATGLSGLYSSLPRKMSYPSDDWYQLTNAEVNEMPDLTMFLNSLEFCNAVVQVAHPLVRDKLLNFIHNGFLVPVLGPALHQTSVEEVIAATAYTELFLRRVTEPALMRTFLTFILTETFDEKNILESLIERINSNSRLCMVTLSLFQTLIDLNCEDVMFQLVFKYLIPCTHVMVSQRKAVRDVDLYGRAAEKLLSLTPTCCLIHRDDDAADYLSKAFDSINNACKSVSLPHRPNTSMLMSVEAPSPAPLPPSLLPTSTEPKRRFSSMDQLRYESHYLEYLRVAQCKIEHCAQSCACWQHAYDGEDPSPDTSLSAIALLQPEKEQEEEVTPEEGKTPPEQSMEQSLSEMDELLTRVQFPPSSNPPSIALPSSSPVGSPEANVASPVTSSEGLKPSMLTSLSSSMLNISAASAPNIGSPCDVFPFQHESIGLTPWTEYCFCIFGIFIYFDVWIAGPFLTTLLHKLECLMQNSLYVNLLLTGLMCRLACFSQPLLRSFLLNHSLVFQPSVKSLVQVLSSVKHKVDAYAFTIKDFDQLLSKARRFLAWREDVYLHGNDFSRPRSDSSVSLPPNAQQNQPKERKRGSAIGDFLFGRKNARPQVAPATRLQLLGDNKGFRYLNLRGGRSDAVDPMEAVRTKNAVYCALVLEEFLKELSAVAQQHSVLAD